MKNKSNLILWGALGVYALVLWLVFGCSALVGLDPIQLNFLYVTIGGVMVLAFMTFGYRLIDALTPFPTGAELRSNNSAVGMVVAGVFIGIGLAVGLTVGLGLN